MEHDNDDYVSISLLKDDDREWEKHGNLGETDWYYFWESVHDSMWNHVDTSWYIVFLHGETLFLIGPFTSSRWPECVVDWGNIWYITLGSICILHNLKHGRSQD